MKLIAESGRYLVLETTGSLHADDYHELAKLIEAGRGGNPTVRVMLRLHDWHGWTLGGAAAGAMFAVREAKHVEKLAIVGEKHSDAALAWTVEVFGSTIVEFFDAGNDEEAWKWLHADETGEYLSYASFGTAPYPS